MSADRTGARLTGVTSGCNLVKAAYRFPVQVKSAAEATDSTEMVMQVGVYGPEGDMKIIDLCDTEEQFKSITVLQLKEKIKSVFMISESTNLRLICEDKMLDYDGVRLSSYGIQHMSVIHTVMRAPGGGARPEMGGGGVKDITRGTEDGGMGDRKDRNQSMERLNDFSKCIVL